MPGSSIIEINELRRNPLSPTPAKPRSRSSSLQVNAWSVAGLYGEFVRVSALRLIRAAPRVAVASDANGGERMPALRLALDVLAAAGLQDAQRLAGAAPHGLLEEGLAVGPNSLAA